ncbi:hypothetical protein J7L06_07420 [Candidatus Bathyarchaeota archaeon]|nr:hypothetical protein [Candidatus Bathyarchaeota archaeon]
MVILKMTKLRDLLSSKKRKMEQYEEECREFEKVMGKPKIEITVEIPEGMEDMREEFMNLEGEERFKKEVEELVKKRLRESQRKRG